MDILRRSVVAFIALTATGCLFDDTAANRTLQVSQLQSTGRLGAFAVDTSRLPPGVVVERNDGTDRHGCPVTSLKLDTGYPVRIVLVPATQP